MFIIQGVVCVNGLESGSHSFPLEPDDEPLCWLVRAFTLPSPLVRQSVVPLGGGVGGGGDPYIGNLWACRVLRAAGGLSCVHTVVLRSTSGETGSPAEKLTLFGFHPAMSCLLV